MQSVWSAEAFHSVEGNTGCGVMGESLAGSAVSESSGHACTSNRA